MSGNGEYCIVCGLGC